jgi:hypothetical protein
MPVKEETVVDLLRHAPAPAHVEPVSVGIPFARGRVRPTDAIEVMDVSGERLPSQVAPLASWPDGSVRWALVDFLIKAQAGDRELVRIRVRDGVADSQRDGTLTLRETGAGYLIDTGAALGTVRGDVFAPLTALQLTHQTNRVELRSDVRLEDARGRILRPYLESMTAQPCGPVRLTLCAAGEFRADDGRPFCRFAARVSFFRGTALVRIDFTIHNPRRATHPRGVWDLGDPGSVLFRALSIGITTTPAAPYRLAWRVAPEQPEPTGDSEYVEIFQASSGGENWSSRNHVDRSGTVRLPFRGCRVTYGERAMHVDRANPVLSRSACGVRASIALTKFWQQFPSALEGGGAGLRAGLFPRQSGESFELQGGEQKTQTLFFQFEADHEGDTPDSDLAWVHDPLVARISPDYFAASEAFPYFVPASVDPHTAYLQLIGNALDGPRSFFHKREAIDEYGWRHFGDTYADHEDVHFAGEYPVISHYNNQYDLLHGFLLHFARSGDPRWFELAADLARHVIDIDLYHSSEDKPAYSGGLFWHTAHYQDAGRATHRSFSADSVRARQGRTYGGGPSNEHNYTTGLLYVHYLTGDPAAREAVRQLADWVIRMDDGTQSLLGHLDPGPTGLASCTRQFSYHGPGRGGGNSVNALIDAYRLTGERRYLTKAEELVMRCVHPGDDPERLNLRDAEARWSYLVFLQVLGKYLDLKVELAECDRTFAYAQASLLRYAGWMIDHEEPFLARADRLEYATESWPAQDVRKSCVFDYAAKYGAPETRSAFTAKADFFFRESIHGVLGFKTHACTRPLAILLTHGTQRAGCLQRRDDPIPPPAAESNFGVPSGFLSQRDRVKRQLRTAAGLLKLVRAALRPSVVGRVLAGRIW